LKVLHITNWYPSKFHPKEALWIARHIKSIEESNSKVVHVEIYRSNKIKIRRLRSDNLNQYLIYLPFEIWFLNEIIYSAFLFYILVFKIDKKKYDIINFHIAYPMLTYWHLLKRILSKPIIITEHWSAYHYNFGVKKRLPRIERIFQQNIPLITVSKALLKDIESFSQSNCPSFTVPNIVDDNTFYPSNAQKENFFFMLSQWKAPKTPIIALKAFMESSYFKDHKLIVGGYGPLWNEIEKFVANNGLSEKINLLGKIDSSKAADYMRRCRAFLHPSDYETFSVVCAEAISSGALVIAPRIGGIPEVINNNGILIKENSLEKWKAAFLKLPKVYKPLPVNDFSKDMVRKKYLSALKATINAFEK